MRFHFFRNACWGDSATQSKPRRRPAQRKRLSRIQWLEERLPLAAAVGVDDTFVLGSVSAVTSFGTVLSNDHDPDGDSLTAELDTFAAAGTLSLDDDGTFGYVPGGNFRGIDSFVYRPDDGASFGNLTTAYIVSQQANTVRKLYGQVLGRDPERGGWDFWTDRINAGTATLGTIASQIFESNERLDPIISEMYRDYLFREADQAGLAYWRDGVWKREGGSDNVIAGIVSSDEFFASAGGTNSGWVSEMYFRLLERAPDPEGQDFWTGQLDSNLLNRQQVVLAFVRSNENFHNLVEGWHVQYLGRSATWVEEEIFVQQLESGVSQRSIQIQILDSPEYIATLLDPEPGTAAPADISGFGVTDEFGEVTLTAGGREFSFALFDEQTLEPLNEYAASFVLDPESRGVGMLSLLDIRGARPPKIVLVVDGEGSTAVGLSALSSASVVDPISILISKAQDGLIETVIKSAFSEAAFEKLESALKIKDLTLLGLKTLIGLGVIERPQFDDSFTTRQTPEQAMADIEQEIQDSVAGHALMFGLSGGAYQLEVAGVAVELGNFLIDASTVLACQGEAPPGTPSVSVTTIPGLGKLYSCAHDDADHGEELVSVHVPSPADMFGGSLELLSQGNLGQGYYANFEPGNNAELHVEPGRYRAIVRAPGFDPHVEDIVVPHGGLSRVLSLNPGTTQRISIEMNQTELMRLNTSTDYNILLATAHGGFPPYTFTLESGVGFQPLGMQLVTEGDKLYLRGRPAAGSANPFVRKFGVCVKDLAGASDCVDEPFTYVVSSPGVVINPTSGLVTTESGGSASFTVALASEPEFPVTIDFTSSNPAEGDVTSGPLFFTPDDWNVPQTVVVTGEDDFAIDGNVPYVIFTDAFSFDPAYNGLNVADVVVVNVDDDVFTPTPDTTGVWQGPFTQSNPLGTQSGTMTLQLQANPQFTTVVTGTITLTGGGTRSLTGTVSGSRFVFNVETTPGLFLFHQLTGTVIGNQMIGESVILDISGGETLGDFNLTKIA